MSTRFLLLFFCVFAALGPGLACAQGNFLSYSIEPKFFASELISSGDDQLQEARFNSGLEVALSNQLVQVAVDYQVQSLLREESALDDQAVSQRVGASLSSSALNQLLGFDAGISADSMVTAGGDIFRYRVTPGLSTSLHDLADLTLQYQYQLHKAATTAVANERRGLFMGLTGSLQQGRLSWDGAWESFSEFANQLTHTRSTDLFKFNTRYQLAQALQLELSSAVKHETLFAAADSSFYSERLYGAGVAWSPSESYSLSFKVNRLDETRYDQHEVYGSGTLNWFPQRNLRFSLGYGDQLVDGERGLLFSTRIDLDNG